MEEFLSALHLALDLAAANDFQLPPLSPAQKNEIVAGIGFITGDGNPLDAWGSGMYTANLPQALALFDASPNHDVIVMCRDNFDDQAFDVPETARGYFDLFVAAAERSSKPHYVLTSRPGVMDRSLVTYLRERGIARLFLAGLALDFCVRYSAEDAKAEGFEVLVIEDACRAIDLAGSLAATRERLGALGIPLIATDRL